jgi:hypothetical protein
MTLEIIAALHKLKKLNPFKEGRLSTHLRDNYQRAVDIFFHPI